MGLGNHGMEHSPDFLKVSFQKFFFIVRKVSARGGKIKPMQGLQLFGISIRQFAGKMLFVAPFSPGLGDLSTYGP